jgi:uncharacterized membrane protein YfcA
MEYYFAFLFIAGIIGGFIGGLLGIGGGIIYIVVIPVALTGIGVPRDQVVQYTIANSVFASFFSSFSANFILIRNNNFYLKEVLVMGCIGIITSLLLLQYVVNTSWYSKELFNIVIVVLLAYMLLKFVLHTFSKKKKEEAQEEKANMKLGLVGLVAGSVSALSGLGGGIVIIPILHSLFHMEIKKANAISLGVIGITSFVMSIFSMLENTHTDFRYYSLGYIILPVAVALSAGVVVASPLGVKASRTISPQILSYLFSFFMALIIIRKIIEITAS